MPAPLPSLNDRVKSLWAPVGTLIGAVSAVYTFTQLWRGDTETLTWIACCFGVSLTLIALLHVAFSKTPSMIDSSKRVFRFPRLYKVARLALTVIVLSAVAAGGFLYSRIRVLHSKLVVLVADFYTDESNKYQVTEEVLSQLGQSLAGYDDTLIFSLSQTITEQEGSQKARAVGERYRAGLVLWGRYAVTSTDVRVTVHVENLTPYKKLQIPTTGTHVLQAPVAELQTFQFQEHLSKEMVALTLFVGGLIRYEAKDYADATRRMSAAIQAGHWPEDLITEAVLFDYRGSSEVFLEHYQEALEDFSQAIQINPRYAEAHVGRGLTYALLENMDRAFEEFSQAIEISPQLAAAYVNRGNIYNRRGETQKAIEDFSQAIQIEPGFSQAYSSRCISYTMLADYHKAIEDCSLAIQYDPENYSAFNNRGFAYAVQGDHARAISDYSHAILINQREATAYNNRGASSVAIGKTDKGLMDFTEAIRINPRFVGAYYNRGALYAALGEHQKAIADFSRAISRGPTDADILYHRGLAYRASGEQQRAIADFQSAIVLSRDVDFQKKVEAELLDTSRSH